MFLLPLFIGLLAKVPAEFFGKDEGSTSMARQARYLYVAVPGIRDYLSYGGHGVLVFDIDNHHKFVKRIKTQGLHPDGAPSNVKGIAVSLALNSLL